jgi:hypothetical protein
VESMRVLSRIPSLEELLDCGDRPIEEGGTPDLSPLFTSELRPLLPRLHTFHFPSWFEAHLLPEHSIPRFVDSSASFLTAYSAQLQELHLVSPTLRSTSGLLECALLCSNLTVLHVCSREQSATGKRDRQFHRTHLSPGVWADVEELHPSVAALPPLLQLRELSFFCLYFTPLALSQFLTNCPAIRICPVHGVPRHFPDTLELKDGRTVQIRE